MWMYNKERLFEKKAFKTFVCPKQKQKRSSLDPVLIRSQDYLSLLICLFRLTGSIFIMKKQP